MNTAWGFGIVIKWILNRWRAVVTKSQDNTRKTFCGGCGEGANTFKTDTDTYYKCIHISMDKTVGLSIKKDHRKYIKKKKIK